MHRRAFVQRLATAAALLRRVDGLAAFDRQPPAPAELQSPVLRYSRPAAKWVEALPIGNGRVGGMVFGGIGVERLQLNEDTLWSGGPTDWNNPGARDVLPLIRAAIAAGRYVEADGLSKRMMGPYTQTYLPTGDLEIVFDHGDSAADYRRTLDLATALATTTYRIGGVHHSREVIASAPARAIVLRLTADRPGQINLAARLTSLLHHRVTGRGTVLALDGRAPSHVDPNYYAQSEPVRYAEDAGMRFAIRLTAVLDGGRLDVADDGLRVSGASAATLILSAATSFSRFDQPPIANGRDESAAARADLEGAAGRAWPVLLDEHRRDHAALLGRMSLDLAPGSAQPAATTDQRIARSGVADQGLVALLFQYGRYLLIASSRPESQPANLQGLWNADVRAPWSSNYTININTEMNYWPAETANLPELAEPMLRFVEELSVTGAKTAAVNYGASGWTAHHNSDLWRQSAPVGAYGVGDPVWAFWPMAGAWLSQHLYEHYLFGGDMDYLRRRAYPVMRGAALFCLDWLIDDGQGHLTTAPSTSPEHKFRMPDGRQAAIAAGATMDVALVHDLFGNVRDAAETLTVDADLGRRLSSALERLRPYRIGSQGQLVEWSQEFDDPEPQHRHFSHLFGLHPGRHITPRTPELFAAVRRSHELRGDGGTGWSLAWKVNHWARLHDGEQAHLLLSNLLQLVDTSNPGYRGGGGVYANLFDAHPPFQIDGNFGVTSGMIEMLVQSHAGDIHLLPALPRAWPAGRIRGVRARGGFELDLEWSGGTLARATLRSRLGGVARIRTAAPVAIAGAVPAAGPNPNPFFRVHDPGRPDIVDPAAIRPVLLPHSSVVDLPTEAGRVYTIAPA